MGERGTARGPSAVWSRLLERPWLVVGLFVAAGLVALVAYRELPIVRNALLYARIAYNLLDHGGDFRVAEHAFNKAVGFPFLASPLVALFGANVGLKVASFAFTVAWAATAVLLLRRLARVFPIADGPYARPGLLALVVLLNPLVFYQLLSAYPDTLSALAILWALLLLDRLTSEAVRWYDGPLFALVTVLAIWVKHHGFVILVLLLVFAACRWRRLPALWRSRRLALALALASLALLAAVVALAQSGRLPLYNLARNKSNYSGGFGYLLPVIQLNLQNLGHYLLLSLSALAPLALRWPAVRRYKEWYLTLVVLVVTILVYEGALYNMRYFIPAAPLLVWIVAANLGALEARVGALAPRLLLGLFLAVNVFTTVYYNSIAVHDAVGTVAHLPRFDNLRLTGEQRTTAERIALINERVGPDLATLFFAHSYYRDGTWYVWERDGLFDDRLNIVYMRKPYWGRIAEHARRHGVKRALLYTRRDLTTEKKPRSISVEELRRKVYLLGFE